MKLFITIVIAIAICLSVGFIGSSVQAESLLLWYPDLIKSPFTPPNIVFPIAWTALYIMMGISIAFIFHSTHTYKSYCIKIFGAQLAANLLWSILFFYMRSPAYAMLDIILLDILVINYIIRGYFVSWVSSILFIPYLLWLLFATYLNGYICYFN